MSGFSLRLRRNAKLGRYETSSIDALGRASGELVVFFAMNANANDLVFWLLLNIVSQKQLLESVRDEIRPFACTNRSNNSDVSFLKLSIEGLLKRCPLLKACYLEANRLHSEPWSSRSVAKDFCLTEDSSDVRNTTPQSYLLKKDSYVSVMHYMHHTDSRHWEDPLQFKPERFLTSDEHGHVSVDMRTLRPYGGGASMCKGRVFAERECLAMIAGLLTLWEFEPAEPSAGWQMPNNKSSSAVCSPDANVRVRISRRRCP